MKRTCPDCGAVYVTAGGAAAAGRCARCVKKLRAAGGVEDRCRACGQWTFLHGHRRCGPCRRAGRPELAIYLTAEERHAICYLVVGMRPRPLARWFSSVQGARR